MLGWQRWSVRSAALRTLRKSVARTSSLPRSKHSTPALPHAVCLRWTALPLPHVHTAASHCLCVRLIQYSPIRALKLLHTCVELLQ